ncbi:hypothetical protein [Nonomuraea sp. NPDC049709]|uniref:hypothetical protein n=1 Tax=Nonomuraea sp. NPDC049709 TaxID=3154736 RepID=UPI0034379008
MELHRLRAVKRDSSILAWPGEAADLRDSEDFVAEGILGHVDADGRIAPSRLLTGKRLVTLWRISDVGVWRAVNTLVMNQHCYEVIPPWHHDGVLTHAWALEGA